MTDSLLEGFERPLLDLCTDERLRQIEAGESAAAVWAGIDALGYTDALTAVEHDGAGLSLADVFPLFFAAGRAGLSLPFAETAVARAILAAAGHRAGPGCIAMAPAAPAAGNAIVCRDVPGAALAEHVLVSREGAWLLLPCALAQREPGAYRPHASASLRWDTPGRATLHVDGQEADAESICNAVHAAGMAGAMARVLSLSVAYANDRSQFGRPISRFQAVQQELSLLAEQASSAALAARLGCASATFLPDPLLAATAKLRASEAAAKVAAISHAVHGAIGITEEHVLGLYTRRLHEWRACPGTEGRCASRLGEALLATAQQSMFDFVRLRLAP
jgi:acetyl-CoA C-acetyltransferase